MPGQGRTLHPLIAGPVGADIGDGLCRTGSGAGRITATQVAFDYLFAGRVVIDGAKRAGDGAHLAANADIVVDLNRAGLAVAGQGFNRTGIGAPGFGALGAGIGNGVAAVLEFKHLDARAGRIENAFMLVRTGHFTLQATGALVRINKQRLYHVSDYLPG